MLNSTSTSLPLISTLSGQRIYDSSITAQYNTEPRLIDQETSCHDQLFNGGLRADQPGRIFQQGSDGDSLPESPMSSGHDGKNIEFLHNR